MPDKSEKERRKQIIENLRKKSDEEFDATLPISRELFKKLFDYLDDKLTNNGCNNSLQFTIDFLEVTKIVNIDKTIEWLEENGGGCDCEVLANVEEIFL